MTDGEQLLPLSGFGEPDPSLDIRARCQREVESALADVWYAAETGCDIPYDRYVITDIVTAKIAEAGHVGNIAEVNTQLDRLVNLPGMPAKALVRACYVAVAAGSERAFDRLRGMLEAEKRAAGRGEPLMIRGNPDNDTAQPADLLREVITSCEAHNTLASEWINEYAADDSWRWNLSMAHYEHMAKDAAQLPLLLDHTAAELLNSRVHDASFVRSVLPEALVAASDPSLRVQLAQRFMMLPLPQPARENDLVAMVAFGEVIWKDPLLASIKGMLGFIDVTIKRYTDDMFESGMDPADISRLLIGWRTRVIRSSGATPADFVLQVNQLADDLHQMDGEARPSKAAFLHDAEHLTAAYLKDALLTLHAEEYAAHGNFQGARVCLEEMADQSRQKAAFLACLYKATTLEQATLLRSELTALQGDKEITLHIELIKAWFTADPPALEDLALHYAATLSAGYAPTKRNHIAVIQKAIMEYDKEAGLELTRQLLVRMRSACEPYEHLRQLSETLIHHGDLAEARLARGDIYRTLHSPSERLAAIARLAAICPPVVDD